VFRLGAQALVQTVDFFTPIVDDPYAYGRIAGANALSDVYAMGGTPITALAIAGFPPTDFPAAIIREIFAGGHSALAEAGVALLGGHTVQDAEVKFGYAVTGIVDPERLWSNAGARPGDALVLTKPVGTGIVATAGKFQRVRSDVLESAVRSMQRLNSVAAGILRRMATVHGCTDVTGFSVIGHACEMAEASGVSIDIDAPAVPILPGARSLALGNRTGGGAQNRKHFGAHVVLRDVPEDMQALLYDPQTSGGLLASIAPAGLDTVLHALREAGVEAAHVGMVRERSQGPGGPLLTVTGRGPELA
jgi:selenide, water dikinase